MSDDQLVTDSTNITAVRRKQDKCFDYSLVISIVLEGLKNYYLFTNRSCNVKQLINSAVN